MSDKRFTLDTNILVYAIDRDAGEKHSIAMRLIDHAMLKNCVLTVQALAEFYSATTRKKSAKHEYITSLIEAWTEVFPVIGTNGHVLSRALKAVHEHMLSFWDAMIWAAAKEGGCTHLYSEDFQDGQKIGGILILNPFTNAHAVEVDD